MLNTYLIYNMTNQGFFQKSFSAIENPVYNLLSAIKDNTFLGVDLNDVESEIALFPNPATDHFAVRIREKVSSAVTLEIFDISGRKTRMFSLELSEKSLMVKGLDLEPGVYQVICEFGEVRKASKLLIR